MSIKDKIQHIADTYEVSVDWVWGEYEFLASQQITEERKWDYIISRIMIMKGHV